MAKKTKETKKARKTEAPPLRSSAPAPARTLPPGDSGGPKRVVLVSDGTGETGARMVEAAMVQFAQQEILLTRHQRVREEKQIIALCEEAARGRELIVHTLVSPQLRDLLASMALQAGIPCVDLLGPLLRGLGSYFGYEPRSIAGLLHDVNERYFQRIDAMEYTVQHDDGRDLSDLDKADLILLGISRTSKTPLSIYLSHQGWRVCNIPLIRGFELPRQLLEVDQRRIVGLTIDADDLSRIRRARLGKLGQERGGDYAEPAKVLEELEYASEIFRKNRRWPVFNVTGKALEETAAEIIKLMTSRRLAPQQRRQQPEPA
jgi:hypothetical protein